MKAERMNFTVIRKLTGTRLDIQLGDLLARAGGHDKVKNISDPNWSDVEKGGINILIGLSLDDVTVEADVITSNPTSGVRHKAGPLLNITRR